MNEALEDGAKKYGLANWRGTGSAASVYVNAAKRHLALWFDGGQELTSDTAVHNLGAVMACCAILLDAQSMGKLIDDRPEPNPTLDAAMLRKDK